MSVKNIILAVLPPFLRAYATKVEASPLGYRLARGTFWSMAGAIISRGLGIASSVVIARTLGQVGFGELAIINSTVAMFQLFAGFGLGLTATKYVAEYRKSNPLKAGRIIGLAWLVTAVTGGLCAVLFAVFAPWLATQTLAAPHLSGLLRIAAIALFISALNAAQNGALSGFEAFKTIAIRNLIAGLLDFPIMVAGVLLAGLEGAVWAIVASRAFNWFICHLAVRREARRFGVHLSFTGCIQELPLIWKFSLPAVFGGMMVTPVNWVCNAMLVNQPNGYEKMAIYHAANQWFRAVIFLPIIIGSVVLPILSERLGNKDTAQSGKVLIFSMKVNAIIVIPIVFVGCLFSLWIMRLYGSNFSSGWPTLVVVLITAGLFSVQTPVGQIIAASGRMWLGFVMNLGWALAFIGLTYLLLKMGSLGIASARLGAYLLHSTWVFGFAYCYLNLAKGGSRTGGCAGAKMEGL